VFVGVPLFVLFVGVPLFVLFSVSDDVVLDNLGLTLVPSVVTVAVVVLGVVPAMYGKVVVVYKIFLNFL
jgi:hypothetical protein